MQKISPELVKTLQDFNRSWAQKRDRAFSGLDVEALREELALIKDAAIDHSDELLDRFMTQAATRGSHVHFAADSQQANEIIYRVLKERGVRVLVKGKSMVSEETGLNEYLRKRGIEARETDLGEWIIQLAGEGPTHMVMPAIHLNRGQVARIFRERLGEQVPEDISRLVKVARRHVRKKILEAGAGLSGANALLAEEGAILLVTNEGNGRLLTSVPPVHIVLTSREKVLPSLKEALTLLRVLTRNATGQEISSYVSVIAGPPREEQHIVIVDNRRSRMKQDYEFREVLRCIKCSACLNVCPVYQMVGGQEFSYVYMGGIGSLLTAWVHGLKQSEELASYCLSCHRCDQICSVKIPIAELVRKLREKIVRERGGKLWKKAAFSAVLGRPQVERKLFALGRAARPLISKEGRVKLPLAAAGVLRRLEMFPAPAARSFTKLLTEEKAREKQNARPGAAAAPGSKEESGLQLHEVKEYSQGGLHAGVGAGKKVAIFPGCLIENFFPGGGLAAYRLLRRNGLEVEIPFDGCCGFPAANSGFVEEARKEFGRVAEKLVKGDYYRIITLCPTCTAMLREIGPGLMTEIMLDEKKAAVFKERVRTLVSFVTEEGLEVEAKYKDELDAGERKEIRKEDKVELSADSEGNNQLLENARSSAASAGGEADKAGEAESKANPGVEVEKMRPAASTVKEGVGPEVRSDTQAEFRPEPAETAGERIKITYHDSCHHKFVLKEAEVSRRLLKATGCELVEMEQSDVCCGFAGVFSVEQAAVSEELLRQKLEAIEKTGAEVVVMDCPGCLLQIKGGLLAGKKRVKVKHSAELL
ncbi:MAG: LUD domain-containing protein [Candidatus Saccharicenans sp.]|uniref:LUD domain-containing protein n=1 Tax=Candidatus Saccharicenans sp. TaxID=2819258 RepID=UPI00404A130F